MASFDANSAIWEFILVLFPRLTARFSLVSFVIYLEFILMMAPVLFALPQSKVAYLAP